MRRGGGSRGDLFSDSEPEDSIPGLEDLISGVKSPRRIGRGLRGGYGGGVGRIGPTGRLRPWLMIRLVLYAVIFLFGTLALIGGIAQAATDYGDADAMAHSPACAAGSDLTAVTENCVGWMTLVPDSDVYSVSGGGMLFLLLPSGDDYETTFPGNAAFSAAVSGTDSVRAEFWHGDIVALTAGGSDGRPAVTVATDRNPSGKGGVDVGVALIGVALVLFSILLLIGVRAIRYRWLRPGLGLRGAVSAMIVGVAGLLVAGTSLTVQPARIMLILTVAPTITVCLIALMWFLLHQSWKKQSLRYGARG